MAGVTTPPAVSTAYEDLLRHVLEHGTPKSDRTGTGTRSVFGHQMRFDLRTGFPLVTTKRVFLRGVVEELLWFLRGERNARPLQDKGVRIWDEWAAEDGDLGPIYGYQWRSWPTPDGGHIDQLAGVLETLRTNPDSRRMIVSAWNVADLDQMALPPATPSSSSTWPTTASPCSSTSARRTSSSGCRSTSPPTPSSPTWWPSRWAWRPGSSSGPAGTATSTTTTSTRCASS